MPSPQARAKAWGYEVECQTINALAPLFPGLKRTGSVAYKKAAADLSQEGHGKDGTLSPVLIVATKDKGRGNPLLITMSDDDLLYLLGRDPLDGAPPVKVQCKGRAKTWIGGLWRDLRDAV